jgi:hypothetical protein
MYSFFHIIKKIVKIPTAQNFFREKEITNSFLIFIFNNLIIANNLTIQSKFDFFINTLNNVFFTEKQKEAFINIFCIIQKTYFALSKFAYIYKYKRSKIVVDFDLYLIPIDINNKNSICLLQDNNKYYFKINDLINIINTSLCNSPMFFSEPLITKNPYNNLPFNKSTLYNIYFNIKAKTIMIPDLIHKFFLCNFDLNNFEKEYEYLIREYSIINYVNNSDSDTLHDLIIIMIDHYNNNNYYNHKIKIHPNFPKKQLIDIMKPYLLLYYTYNYSLINTKKIEYKQEFFFKMADFYCFNSIFGRKIISIKSYYSKKNIKKYKKIYSYNDRHIKFNNLII